MKTNLILLYVSNLDLYFIFQGHTMDELFMLRYGKFERIPDLVAWPGKYRSTFSI